MSTAPNRGEVAQLSKEKPSRHEPGELKKSRYQSPAQNSAASLKNQAFHSGRVARTAGRLISGRVVLATTQPDDPKAREGRKAAGARAGHVLAQMRAFLDWQGLPHPAPEHQEVWFEIAATCYIAIRGSEPRWTYGINRWVKKYAPDLHRTKSAAWIEDRISDLRREERFFGPMEIGEKLRVSPEAFYESELWDLWPAGMTQQEREQVRKDRKATWQRSDNLAKGKVSRPHSQSDARLKPWEAMGISHSTYKRKKKAGQI